MTVEKQPTAEASTIAPATEDVTGPSAKELAMLDSAMPLAGDGFFPLDEDIFD